MRLRLAAALICLPVVLGTTVALAFDRGERFCTLMAGPAGLQIALPSEASDRLRPGEGRSLVRAHPDWSERRVLRTLARRAAARRPVARVTVCAWQRCRTRRQSAGLDAPSPPIPKGYHRVPVTVAILYRDGRRQVIHARVATRPREINGPGCGTDWVAFLSVPGDRHP